MGNLIYSKNQYYRQLFLKELRTIIKFQKYSKKNLHPFGWRLLLNQGKNTEIRTVAGLGFRGVIEICPDSIRNRKRNICGHNAAFGNRLEQIKCS